MKRFENKVLSNMLFKKDCAAECNPLPDVAERGEVMAIFPNLRAMWPSLV